MDIEISSNLLTEAGEWLDITMPNPPVPIPYRWAVFSTDERFYIRFSNEEDAIWFKLKWL